MISLILIMVAAACNAVMDILSHHYPRSIFSKYSPKWWNPKISWKNKYVDWDNGDKRTTGFVQTSDAWHFFKTLMIIFMCSAVVFYPISIPVLMIYPGLDFLFKLLILGLSWNITFNLCYNVLFRK